VGTILLLSDIHSMVDVVPVLLLGVSLAVAAVHEGLPAILSVVLALGLQRMAIGNRIDGTRAEFVRTPHAACRHRPAPDSAGCRRRSAGHLERHSSDRLRMRRAQRKGAAGIDARHRRLRAGSGLRRG
jgi:hypothetical protein